MPTGSSPSHPETPPRGLPRKRSLLKRAVVGLMMVGVFAVGGAWLLHAGIDQGEEVVTRSIAARHELLGEVKSWGYQLQGLDIAKAAKSKFDLLVVDEDVEGRRRARGANTVNVLQRKPDGKRRLVIAYLSIGEAEDYRLYWEPGWVSTPATALTLTPRPPTQARGRLPGLAETAARASGQNRVTPAAAEAARPLRQPTATAPAWLGDENPDWRGNFRVRFWDEGWQSIILGHADAALERIIAAGFDGVYLDRADVYAHWTGERPDARADMVAMIEKIAERARTLAPGFIVVMQNAEELLGQHRVRAAINAVAKEDLLFGVDGAEKPNSERDVSASLKLLKKAQRDGLPVFVVEYLNDPILAAKARTQLQADGFYPYFAPRALDDLSVGD